MLVGKFGRQHNNFRSNVDVLFAFRFNRHNSAELFCGFERAAYFVSNCSVKADGMSNSAINYANTTPPTGLSEAGDPEYTL